MTGLLAGLASLAAPILARVFLALGFAVVTVTGVDQALTFIRSALSTALAGAPMAALQLAGLAGVWIGLGWVLGAVTFTLSLWSLTKAVRIAKG